MQSASFRGALACLLVACVAVPSDARSFLHKVDRPKSPEDLARIDIDLLKEIEGLLGSEHRETIERRLAPLATLLRPTLGALPKGEDGRYGHAAVSHALKRLFVKRHGWYVNGLHEDGGLEAEQPPNALSAIQKSIELPDRLQQLFEVRLGSHGLTAHDVALLAATLENLVHREIVDRLRRAFGLERMDPNATDLTISQVDRLLDTQMAMYLMPEFNDSEHLSPKKIHAQINEEFPTWSEVRSFVREVRQDRAGDLMSFGFADVAKIVESIGDSYGRWQNHDCLALKRDLLAIQDDGSGRVSLGKFYGAALKGQWQFSESVEYLRQLGALDETSPEMPRVIVSNYVLAPSNCVGGSTYYHQCCLNECEDLFEHLERELQAPSAEPERIASVVAELPSPSTSAQEVPPQLLKRLVDIADTSGGKVPIYGRLFAQWMHHVYPRECPYPHASGATKFSSVFEFIAENGGGDQHMAKPEVMKRFVSEANSATTEATVPWSHHEEVYVQHGPRAKRTGHLAIFRLIPCVAAIASMCKLLWTHVGGAAGSKKDGKNCFFDEDKCKLV